MSNRVFARVALASVTIVGCDTDSSTKQAVVAGAPLEAVADETKGANTDVATVLADIEPLLDPAALFGGSLDLDGVKRKKAEIASAQKKLEPFEGPDASKEVADASGLLAASHSAAAALESILTASAAEVLAEDKRKSGEFVAADTLLQHAETMLLRDRKMVEQLDEAVENIDVAALTKRIAKARKQMAKGVARERRASARAERDSPPKPDGCTADREQVAVEIAGQLWKDPTMSEKASAKIVRRIGKRHGLSLAEADLAYGSCVLNPRVVAATNAAGH